MADPQVVGSMQELSDMFARLMRGEQVVVYLDGDLAGHTHEEAIAMEGQALANAAGRPVHPIAKVVPE